MASNSTPAVCLNLMAKQLKPADFLNSFGFCFYVIPTYKNIKKYIYLRLPSGAY